VRNRVVDSGQDVGYMDNYLTQRWKNTPEEIAKAMGDQKGLSGQPYFAKERIIPDLETGVAHGLTPKYTNPAGLVADYYSAGETAVANQQLVDTLKKNGEIVPVSAAPQGWKIVTAPLFPKASGGEVYAASPENAKLLNNIFDQSGNKLLDYLGSASANVQNLVLSGGIPTQPVNAFVMGQEVKNVTAGQGGTAATALINSRSDDAARAYFSEKAPILDKMASQDIPTHTVFDYSNRFDNVVEKTGLWDKVKNAFHAAVDRPTFGRFYPMQQVDTFEKTYNAGIKSGMSEEEATKVAGDTVKSFYGVTDQLLSGRSADVQNALTAFTFAPHYRESMINLWTNTLKSVMPQNWSDPGQDLARKFAAGTAITFGMYDALNYKLNGRHLWENPEGKKFTLLIPTGDKTLGIPFQPSISTLPRMLGSIGFDIKEGNLGAAGLELRKTTSSLFKPFFDVAANQDYFGRPIYDEQQDSPGQKYGKMLTYIAGQYNHPYIQAIVRGKQTGASPAEIVSTALELPVRFYKSDSITTGMFFDNYYKLKPVAQKFNDLSKSDPNQAANYYSQHQDEIDEFTNLAPLVATYGKLKESGDNAGAANMLKIGLPDNQKGPKDEYVKSSDAPKNVFDTIGTYAHGAVVDPGNTWKALTTDEQLRKVTGNAAILERKKDLNQDEKGMIVDHLIPLSLGGDNSPSNLVVQTPDEAAAKDVLEKQLYKDLQAGKISKQDAQQKMKDWVSQNGGGTPLSSFDSQTQSDLINRSSTNPAVSKQQDAQIKSLLGLIGKTTDTGAQQKIQDTLSQMGGQYDSRTGGLVYSNQYYYPDSTGSIKSISLDFQVQSPNLSGDKTLDAERIKDYKSAVSKKINEVVKLNDLGVLTDAQASALINQLKTSGPSTAKKGRKLPKIKLTAPKIKLAKSATPKTLKFKKLSSKNSLFKISSSLTPKSLYSVKA
jgi:hypothetical protein